ncbi:MAG: 5-(carboxyamino)imidazole ribonucleotide synthase [Cyclobacteriaceae bacterium]|jgi:5-(carboxyamino)imidazole ribonucleotide synthase
MGIEQQKLGVLGGGQLGRMLIQAGLDFNIRFSVLDPDAQAPCHNLAPFTHGKLTDFDTVLAFGRTCDLITIEIENVNTEALRELEKMGKKVFPQPHLIELIQDKRKQKEFYRTHNIPTAEFVLVNNRADVHEHAGFLPAVNKLGKEGYDGRGVQILRTPGDLDKAFDKPGLLEKLIDFDKEIAVIAARNERGEVSTFPAVEMVFHPEHNLVEYLYSPASISAGIAEQADAVARRLVEQLQLVGLLAVEMFVTKDGQVLVNEVAPRPHNSGHHTIEANVTSQYEQHLRAIFNLPLGDTRIVQPSAMVNLLGEADYEGPAKYQGLETVLKETGVHVHLYGKYVTKPFRKMGHVTITGNRADELKQKVEFVKRTLKVIA